jgi:hypothetical protein
MNTINLGEIPACDEAVILPLTANVTGGWTFISNFNGAYKYKQFQAVATQVIAVPVRLNEDYTYNFKLYKPDGSILNDTFYTIKTIPILPDVEYDCTPTDGTDISSIKAGKKQFIAGEGQEAFSANAFKDATQMMVFVEGALRQEGDSEDEYVFDKDEGVITFNTPAIEGQKITILYFK